ncbi:MAG: hypothetical protein ACM3XM_19170 [Mycobacterium leprae]
MVSMGISDVTAHGQKTTTDPTQIKRVMNLLAGGKYVGPANQIDPGPGTGYSVVLNLDNGQYLLLDYWAGGSPYNLTNNGTQQNWSVPGLEEAMKPLLPPKYITLEEVKAIAGQLDPKAQWLPRLAAKGSFAVDGDFVWLAVGLDPDGRRVAYYLHPVTGELLKTDPPETTEPAEAAVRSYFGLMAKGDYEGGWNLVHSLARNLVSTAPVDGRKAQFMQKAANQQWSVIKVGSGQWEPDFHKYYDCQCGVFDVVDINVTLTSGATRRVLVAKDTDGVWRILWSAYD